MFRFITVGKPTTGKLIDREILHLNTQCAQDGKLDVGPLRRWLVVLHCGWGGGEGVFFVIVR